MIDLSREQPKFSHVSYATDYMQIAVERVIQYFGGDIRGSWRLIYLLVMDGSVIG